MAIEIFGRKLEIDIETFSVVWVILTSGTMVFNIVNMMPSMFILLGSALLMLLKYKTISRYNFMICLGLCIFTLISTLVNGIENLVINDLIILLIRWFSLIVIMSNVDSERLKKIYINTIFVIAAISLPCFFLKLLVPSFTFPFTFQDADTGFYGTFYYTLGTISKGVLNRNCGIFWESGLFQIYLNYALALLVVNQKKFEKNVIIKFVVMSVAVITTLSTMGYICYGIVICMLLLSRQSEFGRKAVYVAIIALIALLAVESTTHIIEYKLIDQGMSYGSRYDDTLVSFAVAKDYPIWGVGPASDHVSIVESYEAVVNRMTTGDLSSSNGLGNFLVKFGIPMTIVYLILVYKRNLKINNTTRLKALLILIMLICCFCNEPIMFTTLWLSFFFEWREPENEEESAIDDYYSIGYEV